MNNIGRLIGVIVVLVIIGIVAVNVTSNNNGYSGIDVSGTNCDSIAVARTAVDNEYQERQYKAESDYTDAMEQASDDYWAKYNPAENEKYACESDALLADPCKDLFERFSILAGVDNGFAEEKYQERERAKAEYDECLKNPPVEKTYEGKKAKCDETFSTKVAEARSARKTAETTAISARDTAITNAETDYNSKHATLAAIEKECNTPPTTTNITVGEITTGSTGTVIQSGNPACTDHFSGYDPEIQAEIDSIQQLYNQAQAGGKTDGLGGTSVLGAKLTELRLEMVTGDRKCQTDSDCGDLEPVCCSDSEVDQVMCSDGVCVSKKNQCEDNEVCTGQPAQCFAPDTGLMSQPINISKSIIIGQSCNNTIQVLNLRPATEDSSRYEITGDIPNWLNFSQVSGSFPQDVDVNANCGQLQTSGPSIYTASGIITIYDPENNLLNTIPLNVVVTVIAAPVGEENNTENLIGQNFDPILVEPSEINFVYNHAQPVCPLPITPISITGPKGSTWSITSDLPIWLNAKAISGLVPGTFNLQFPCVLDLYVNQQQSTKLNFQIQTPNGIETASVQVNGSFINF